MEKIKNSLMSARICTTEKMLLLKASEILNINLSKFILENSLEKAKNVIDEYNSKMNSNKSIIEKLNLQIKNGNKKK